MLTNYSADFKITEVNILDCSQFLNLPRSKLVIYFKTSEHMK